MKPVLLLIPGMLNDSRVWAGVADRLGGLAEVRHANVSTQIGIREMAEDAWRILDDVPGQTRVVLAGFSLGGYVAIEMMARPARAIQSAALLSTSARPETAEGAAVRTKSIAAMQKDFEGAVNFILRSCLHAPGEERLKDLRQMMHAIGADSAIRQTLAIMKRSDHRGVLKNLCIPVLIMCGREDRITPPTLSEELARLVPFSRNMCVDGAGHMLPYEQPGVVADAMHQILHSGHEVRA